MPGDRLGLTKEQAAALAEIRRLTALHGYSPTLEEIAAGLGVSKTAAWRRVAGLKARGAVRSARGRARSLAVVGDAPPAASPVPA